MICATHQIVWVINSTKIRGAGMWHVILGRRKYMQEVGGEIWRKEPLGRPSRWEVYVKLDLKEYRPDERWLDSSGSGEKNAGFCEHGNDRSVSTKCGGFPDQLRNYQLITQDHSASLNSSICDSHGQTVSSLAFLEAQTADRMKTLPVLEWEISAESRGLATWRKWRGPRKCIGVYIPEAHRFADTNATGCLRKLWLLIVGIVGVHNV